LRKEEYENGHASLWHAIDKGARPGEEAKGDGVTSQPVDGNSHQAAPLTNPWIHGSSVVGGVAQ